MSTPASGELVQPDISFPLQWLAGAGLGGRSHGLGGGPTTIQLWWEGNRAYAMIEGNNCGGKKNGQENICYRLAQVEERTMVAAPPYS